MHRHPGRLGVWPAALLILLSASSARAETLRFFAAGDLPYFAAETEQLRDLLRHGAGRRDALLDPCRRHQVRQRPCTDANLEEVAALFRARAVPVVFTPGDNEWTDCHRERAGAKDPPERLARVREVFYGDPGVLRLDRLGVVRAEGADATDYPENYIFIRDGVLFVSVHVVGSNNGYAPTTRPRSPNSRRAMPRTCVFCAKRPSWHVSATRRDGHHLSRESAIREGPTGARLRSTAAALVELMGAYPGPVLAIHGDTHRFKHDRPLIDPATGEPFERFVRTEVPGSPVVGGVWISVEPQAEEPFGSARCIRSRGIG
jgi:hypothetical protein